MKKHHILIIAILVSTLVLVGAFCKEKPQTCKCLEVVGDEDNFVCYKPDGELDTKGECVGDKIYK